MIRITCGFFNGSGNPPPKIVISMVFFGHRRMVFFHGVTAIPPRLASFNMFSIVFLCFFCFQDWRVFGCRATGGWHYLLDHSDLAMSTASAEDLFAAALVGKEVGLAVSRWPCQSARREQKIFEDLPKDPFCSTVSPRRFTLLPFFWGKMPGVGKKG